MYHLATLRQSKIKEPLFFVPGLREDSNSWHSASSLVNGEGHNDGPKHGLRRRSGQPDQNDDQLFGDFVYFRQNEFSDFRQKMSVILKSDGHM
jgi:hypothetical protein